MSNARASSEYTFLDVALARFDALCAAVSISVATRARSSRVVQELLMPWGELPIGPTPLTSSKITDDHGPIEFSLAFHGPKPEVRLLFEPLGRNASMIDHWEHACRLNERLGRRGDVDLERLARIQDLFAPRAKDAHFVMWHSLCVAAEGKPRFKIYLNPQAQGRERAPFVVAEAVRRLGFSRACAEQVSRLRRIDDELRFFSLDLDPSSDARVKIYKVHHAAARSDIECELAVAQHASPQALSEFWQAFAPGSDVCRGLPISTYLSLTSDSEQPTTATMHFPVRGYAQTDQQIYERVCAFLRGPECGAYQRAIAAFATRPLDAGIGMQSYVSLRQHAGPRRITIYLSPELYRVEPARKAVA
jgi:DMATS type aromatic prenyltransferase